VTKSSTVSIKFSTVVFGGVVRAVAVVVVETAAPAGEVMVVVVVADEVTGPEGVSGVVVVSVVVA
jgi:hypothetical protein